MTTYKAAGVDLDSADAVVSRITEAVKSTWREGVVADAGGFAAGIGVPSELTEPVFMMTTDGVGTKIDLARAVGDVSGLGRDLAAMVFDDLAAAGAKPLAVTDYIAAGTLDLDLIEEVVGSLAMACREVGAALLGGETAEHPGVGSNNSFDISATALGVAERARLSDQTPPQVGDLVIGLVSPNLRSNGFSLVRAVFDGELLDDRFDDTSTVGQALIAPSVLYAPALGEMPGEVVTHGLAHITGGGMASNVARILPADVSAVIDRSTWSVPRIFGHVASTGGIADEEMFRVFNMGIGFVVTCPPEQESGILDALAEHEARVIGEVARGTGNVEFI